MGNAISVYDDLVNAVQRLGPPREGFVRVFRGETAIHKPILASRRRPGAPAWNRMIWDSYVLHLADDMRFLARENATIPPNQQDDDFEDIVILAFWVAAIAQHYGPNSNYLDVTHSLDVALWFALHQPEPVKMMEVLGPPGPFNPTRDTVLADISVRYRPWNEASGVLYVFDVPEWDGDLTPKHGGLLDIAKAPAMFASSERIKAQSACLLQTDPDVDGGDLSSFLRCDPIPIHWPMTTAPRIQAATEELFPSPVRDEWYRRFLSIPVMVDPDASAQRLVMQRPLPITLYIPDKTEEVDQSTQYTNQISPVLLYPILSPQLTATFPGGLLHRGTSEYARDATPIILESPFKFTTPEVGGHGWNQGVLSSDMSDRVDTYVIETGQPSGPVSLQNVVMEFNPLEEPGWERSEEPGTTGMVLRAAWLVRRHPLYILHLIYQTLPDMDVAQAGPIYFQFDEEVQAFHWRPSKGKTWADIDAETPGVKEFFIMLMLLRTLSPVVKPDPFPAAAIDDDDGDGQRHLYVTIRGAASRLLRVSGGGVRRDWYVLRDAASNLPFFFSDTSSRGVLSFDSPVPWPNVDARELRASIQQP